MASVREIINIDSQSIGRLNDAGVHTLEQLLEVGATSSGRMHLADETRLDDETIKAWVHEADLMRVKGVGPELAHLLRAAGVSTTPKLAYRTTDALHADLIECNRDAKTMRTIPGISELHQFIVSAKSLPKLIRH